RVLFRSNGSYSAYNFNEPVTKNLKLYANWTRKSHSVTFDADNGTEIQKKSYYWGDKITEPTDPSKEHYSFTGWYVDGADMPFDFDGSVVKADFTLTARYTPVEYTVTLNANGGTLTTTSFTTDINKHFVISGVEIPSKTDYTFSHWINVTNDGEVISSTAIHTYQFVKNTNLTAIYTPTEKRVIFYNYEDSTGTTQKVKYLEVTTNIEKGHVLSSGDIPENPSRTGYTFNGWTLTAGGENINVVTYEFKSLVTEVYPNYTINKFNITFYNGSAIHYMLEEVSYNSKITAPTEEPKLTDYEFVGWYKDFAFTVAFDFTNDTITTDTCLYAQFTEDLSIWRTISLVTNWEGVELEDLRLKNTDTLGNNYTPDTFTRRIGYTFGGWYIDDSTFSNRVNSDSVINTFVPEDAMSITLYAKWTKNTYPLTFKHADGTDYVATQPIEYGAPIVKPTDPIIEGYNFLYWYETAGEEFDFNNATMPAREIILYAKVEILSFTLYFHREEGGEFKIGDGEYSPYYSAEYEYGTSISKCPVASYPTRTGETCVGWDTAFPLTMPASDVHVYAQWSKNKHTITYYTNSTTDTLDANSPIFERKEGVEYNTLLSELTTTNTPADDAEFKEGYTFGGWQYYVSTIDEQGTAIYEEAYTLPDEDVIALAIWNKEIYTITAKVQGNEDQIINVLYGESIKEALKSVALISDGYIFDSTWTYDNTTISENYDTLMPAKNIICIANYSVNSANSTIEDLVIEKEYTTNNNYAVKSITDKNFGQLNINVLKNACQLMYVTFEADYYFGKNSIIVTATSGDDRLYSEDINVETKSFSFECTVNHLNAGITFTFKNSASYSAGRVTDYTITNIRVGVSFSQEQYYTLTLRLNDPKNNYKTTDGYNHATVDGAGVFYFKEGDSLQLPIPTKAGFNFNGYTFVDETGINIDSNYKITSLPARDIEATPEFSIKSIAGNDSTDRTITEQGKWCLEQSAMDTINISALKVFFNDNYEITFKFAIECCEEDDGYQELALYNNKATVSNSTSLDAAGAKANGMLGWWQFEHGSGELDTGTYWHEATNDGELFTVTVSGAECKNYMYVRYDANGKGDDDWVKTNLKYEITVTEKSN
ncbi:MAG: InlB B-repeat-containing protein, partial [Clostridia bacterium]|nr:InlB B-repeat-containing protein [Clostridia bacterium]